MAVTTFDGPLMAINYARAAHSDFIQMQMAGAALSSTPTRRRAPPSPPRSTIIASTFFDDLDVAEQALASDADEQQLIGEIRPAGETLAHGARQGDDAERAGKTRQPDRRQIRSADRAQHRSQLRRPPPDRRPISAITNMPPSATTMLALLLAAGITLFLRSRIVRPLSRRGLASPTASPRANCRPPFPPAAPTRPAPCSNP